DVSDDARGIVVPATAVFAEQGRTFVFVAGDGGRFVRRAIDIAQDHGDERRVLRGLKAGERIVVDGVLLLRQEEQQRQASCWSAASSPSRCINRSSWG